MYDAGLEPDTVSFNTMIKTLVSCDNLECAEDFLKQLGDRADKHSFGTIMMAHARKGSVDKVSYLFTEMDSKGIFLDVQAYASMVLACSKARDLEGAKEWLAKTLEAGHKPDLRLYTPVVD